MITNSTPSREMVEKFNGKILTIKPTGSKSVSLFCHICKFPMTTLDDVISFRKLGCCSQCDMRWSNSKLGDLKSGWIPDSSTDGWEDYVEIRNIRFKSLINLK